MGPMVSWLTIGLSAADGGTRLELVHESPVDPEFAAMYGPGAVGVGWDLALMGLGLHLEDSTPVDPAEFETFTFSPEGIALVEHSATGWAEAAIADGDEPGPAREAAARTVTFYTVMPEEDPSACVEVEAVFDALGDGTRRNILVVLSGGAQPAGKVGPARQDRGDNPQPANYRPRRRDR